MASSQAATAAIQWRANRIIMKKRALWRKREGEGRGGMEERRVMWEEEENAEHP